MPVFYQNETFYSTDTFSSVIYFHIIVWVFITVSFYFLFFIIIYLLKVKTVNTTFLVSKSWLLFNICTVDTYSLFNLINFFFSNISEDSSSSNSRSRAKNTLVRSLKKKGKLKDREKRYWKVSGLTDMSRNFLNTRIKKN